MKRLHLVEIHDLVGCPPLLRSSTADLLEIATRFLRIYDATAVFEGNKRTLGLCLAFLLIPLVVWSVTPFLRPFRWRRLLWTCLVPLYPAAMLWDGLVSNLRAYSVDELRELTASIDVAGYEWEVSRLPGGWRPAVTYLLGFPRVDR